MRITAFHAVLRVVTAALAAITVVSVPLLVLFVTGRGPISVQARLDPPYTVDLFDGRSIVVGDGGSVGARVDFDVGEESRYLKAPPQVDVDVRVDRDDADSRLVLSVMVVVLLGVAWLAVVMLRGVVASARRDDPFEPANSARLRWLAGCVFAGPIVIEITSRILDSTLDVDPPVTVVAPRPSWWAVVILAAGILALSEVFGEGADLRQFERETI